MPTRDASGTVSNNVKAGTTLTTSYAVSAGADRCLVVRLAYYHPSAETISGVAYGGVPLTRVGSARFPDGSGGDYAEIWQLVNPTVGTANLVITSSASVDMVSLVDAWTGVHQTTPFGPFTGTSGTSTGPSLSVTSTSGDTVLDALSLYPNQVLTIGAGQIQDGVLDGNGGGRDQQSIYGSHETASGATTTMSWTLPVSAAWWYGAASLQPPVGGGGGDSLDWAPATQVVRGPSVKVVASGFTPGHAVN